ncbi:3',5'-cyclic-nucleotide phosphodiesterase PDE2 [Lachancea thermotolerans CBS 6340]|uniref:Phosphodiesterase n=1 Tax=Lachancea thermotolerans (strain ATCC 56472 / CBS 6340 / NRRL Y-8284) TaxID=559295 RepID=C5DFY9_LACTC|nr:KLTH0D01034p [Lachancea thermotolerans CBS 6340]CAR22331.1 KLTH0D01034p [Lachancea thermotolerans CBS 6340]
MSSMATLFTVNSPELAPQLASRFKGHVVALTAVADLLARLYSDRLSGADNYERDLYLVVYCEPKRSAQDASPPASSTLDTLSAAELAHLLEKQFPCFNLSVVTPERAVPAIAELDNYRAKYTQRLTRVTTWMYAKRHDPCSVNMYSMISHLTQVRHSNTEKPRRSYARLISSSLDLRKLIQLPQGKSDDHYWKLLTTWDFCALSLSTCELIWCSYLILKKLAIDADYVISDNDLFLLLLTLETSYHQGNKFHNFRHAVDVMQATWQLCCKLQLHFPKDASVLLVCVAAIGHDLGHPGTNNALMCEENSPVAQLYQKASVLENFHTELFLDLLQDHWPQLLEDRRNVISDTILATDMALHSQYIDQMDEAPSQQPTFLSLIIKAADISNVTRPLEISAKWAVLITCEFNECAALVRELKEGSAEYDAYNTEYDQPLPESVDSILEKFPSIPKGQLIFINAFAEGLFAGLGDYFEELKFLHHNVQANKKFWEGKL